MFVGSLRRRSLLCLRSNSTIPNLSPLPTPPLLPFRFLSVTPTGDSPTVTLLIDSLGFSPETALSVFRKLQNKDTRNADSVISFLKSRDFSAAQISEMVRRYPGLLRLKPERTLLPKLEFFQYKGLSRPELSELLSSHPRVLCRSLERSVIPNFNFFRSWLKSDLKALQLVIRHLYRSGAQEMMAANLKHLLDNGVSEWNAASILQHQTDKLYSKRARLSEAVRVLKEMGLDPEKATFGHALSVVLGMSKSSWESKARVYRKWGWSDKEFLSAFRKFPLCMAASEVKINQRPQVGMEAFPDC
ncbi:uncharacterized protein LOC116210586 [Punica granatum]|uniref:Uncharacterized protein LOC116210586 n=1 Tax=Punica granatum TaxID=22663 RepID=A0A6P8DSF9_PUNGR|nr:uncharacterized protein LOC116210586 [Punica granatum]XP_031400367.1 uncharacterized protein LOC116210586 [Punica granatum]